MPILDTSFLVVYLMIGKEDALNMLSDHVEGHAPPLCTPAIIAIELLPGCK